ncbi:MAG: nucleotide exchange factor GrpE, partial [Alphaproteobacteria bacterium]
MLQKLLRRIDDPQLEEHDAEDLTVDEQKDLEDSYIALNDLLNKSKNVEEENQKLREEMNAQSLRNDRDKQEFMKYAISEFATDMVVVADNIRRAIETVSKEQLDASPVLNNLVEGFEVTERSLLSALKRHQVTRFDPLGEPFNPYLHEAKFTENTTDYPADTVVRVIHAGFMIGERLLRPAGVVVSQNSSDAQPSALRSTDNAKHANGANSGRYPQQANAYDRSASVLHKPIITGAQETSAPPYPTSSGQKATYGAADISHVSDLAKTIENMQSQIQAANDAFEDKNYKEAARLQENIAKAVSIAEAASEGGFGDSTLDALLSLTWYQLFAGQYEAVVA